MDKSLAVTSLSKRKWNFADWTGRSVVPIASLASLVAWLYQPFVVGLALQWWSSATYRHGFLIPLMSAYFVWARREVILRERGVPSWWSMPLVVAGSLTFLTGTLFGDLLITGTSLVLVLLGSLLALGGVPLFRAAWFPVVFLAFGLPLPDGILIGTLGDPLRDQAAHWSAALLEMLGYSVYLEGTLLHLPRATLEVAYECSGIRGLIAAIPLASAFAYVFHRSWWQRGLLILAAVPIGLVSNVLRIVGIAVWVYEWPALPAVGDFHGPTGWIPTLFILPSLLVVSGVIRWVDRGFLSTSR